MKRTRMCFLGRKGRLCQRLCPHHLAQTSNPSSGFLCFTLLFTFSCISLFSSAPVHWHSAGTPWESYVFLRTESGTSSSWITIASVNSLLNLGKASPCTSFVLPKLTHGDWGTDHQGRFFSALANGWWLTLFTKSGSTFFSKSWTLFFLIVGSSAMLQMVFSWLPFEGLEVGDVEQSSADCFPIHALHSRVLRTSRPKKRASCLHLKAQHVSDSKIARRCTDTASDKKIESWKEIRNDRHRQRRSLSIQL